MYVSYSSALCTGSIVRLQLSKGSGAGGQTEPYLGALSWVMRGEELLEKDGKQGQLLNKYKTVKIINPNK